MSNEEIQIDDTPSNGEKKLAFTKTFTVQYIDPDTGAKMVGTFTTKRVTIGDLSSFGIIKSRLNGGSLQVDRGIDWMNEMLAFCQVSLTDVPGWWNPEEMYDQTLLVKVYNHVRSFQDSFRGRRVGEQRGASANNGSGSAGVGVAPAVVVQEVQPPA